MLRLESMGGRMRALVVAALSLSVADYALADEKPVQLKRVPGFDKVEAKCGACHSLDYITMNSPFLNKAQWKAEVSKMINAFGAPINDADAKTIVDYVMANYGRGSAQGFPRESAVRGGSAGGFHAGRLFPTRAAFAPHRRDFSVEIQGCNSQTVTVRTFNGDKAKVTI